MLASSNIIDAQYSGNFLQQLIPNTVPETFFGKKRNVENIFSQVVPELFFEKKEKR